MHTAVDTCHDTLRDRILRGAYPVGDRLPPERRLADELGVGRPTVRSALARLVSQGLVSPRQGSGYVVHDYRWSGGPELIPELATLTERGDLDGVARDLLLVRRHLATGVLERLAATPPGPVDQLRFAAAVDAFAEAADRGDPEELAPLDLAVVAALLAATGSPVLSLCLHPIARVLQELAPLRAAVYSEPAGNVLGWRALQAWLTQPSADTIPGIAALLAERDAMTVRALTRSTP